MYKFEGVKTTLGCTFGLAVCLLGALHFQSNWQHYSTTISQLTLPILLFAAGFAAQFNRSRLALVCLLWTTLFASQAYTLPWSDWLDNNASWQLLCGAITLWLMSLMKDKALLSRHLLSRLVMLCAVGVSAHFWLISQATVNTWLANNPYANQLTPYVTFHAPLWLIGMLLFWRSLTQKCLTRATLFSSFMLWLGIQLNWLALPLDMVVVIVALVYLVTVSIDGYFLAYRDDLTGLPTRRALNQLSLSLGRKYTVAMLDIDHFKKFNDTYGHDIGDQVLKLVASKLTKVKSGGKVFRYGGEEFTVVFPSKTSDIALNALEQLREDIANYDMIIRQQNRQSKQSRRSNPPADRKVVNVTVSIGIASRQAKQKFEDVIKTADIALYRAKKKGRNNVSD
ncbi:GGDEF domain-containing protein [Pseudoalteromonas sp. SMS1]|uniref:GGDEF domain-containing protein n=1 Tax=Pseudoalteromonas sp. SMS1 TaxID=2908894 RepID=UPI001F266A4D|nr:GGDEF domain-containing protein [Pseudoalteromonas sp. SMS1]MCF2856415.1 GGDEF domain-containing protein [Pseudoalteromonas sp. SMS1]